LSENQYSRTNVSLANPSDTGASGITISVMNDQGEFIGEAVPCYIPPHSTTQKVRIAEQAGILSDLDIFSLYIVTNGNDLYASASIVDNTTGDPVHVESVSQAGEISWVPGIAHLSGANDSQWRSDITFFNNTFDEMHTHFEYISPENAQIGFTPGKTLSIPSANASFFKSVLGSSMLPAGVESKGYFIVNTLDGTPLPQIVAKTYNVDDHGGTFGQNLKVFTPADLISAGESGYITGVSNSSDPQDGFRTNVGVLNTSETNTARIEVYIFDEAGNQAGRVPGVVPLGPGVSVQENVFVMAYLANVDMVGSVEIRVLEGGPVAAYGSQVDNRTQDPILVPAVTLFTQ
jgi:hypothetical protein